MLQAFLKRAGARSRPRERRFALRHIAWEVLRLGYRPECVMDAYGSVAALSGGGDRTLKKLTRRAPSARLRRIRHRWLVASRAGKTE